MRPPYKPLELYVLLSLDNFGGFVFDKGLDLHKSIKVETLVEALSKLIVISL